MAALVDDEGAKELLEASRDGRVDDVRRLLLSGVAASTQDDSTGYSALMLAAGCPSLECVSLLLDSGAPWNALDRSGRCAGEHAVDARCQQCVDALVNAGVAAQLLFGVLEEPATTDDRTTDRYLSTDVTLSTDGKTLNDADGDAVMMEWETPLMEAHADVMVGNFPHEWSAALKGRSLDVCNVGHGMAIIDDALALRLGESSTHTIIEPHDGVLERMRDQGWLKRPGVHVAASTWQDAVSEDNFGPFDAVFFDTYAEKFADMRDFFRILPKILKKPHGVFSFFNGMCPFNTFFHGVACELVKIELGKIGMELDFVPLKVDPLGEATWHGVKRRYWLFDAYHMPIARWTIIQEAAAPP